MISQTTVYGCLAILTKSSKLNYLKKDQNNISSKTHKIKTKYLTISQIK